MSKKIDFLTGSQPAIEHLRIDIQTGELKLYTLPEFPPGIFPQGYANQCYGYAAAISGSGNFDYLAVLALRPDTARGSSDKVIDLDTAVFCFKTDDLQSFPTGVILYHQNYSGRTTPMPGFGSYTLEQTVNQLHSSLIPGATALSGSPQPYLNAISHSIAKLNEQFALQISGWDAASQPPARPEVAVEPPQIYPAEATSTPPGEGSKPDL